MTTTIERRVTVNPDYFGPGQGVYVLRHDGGCSCLGFDVCIDRTERILTELVGRGAISEAFEQTRAARAKELRGTIHGYDHYQSILALLRKVCQDEGDRAVYDLSPQLQGLEGWRVEVVDQHDERRRFIVGRSGGWAPCHLEIARRDSSDGVPASREYKSVRQIEQVR